MHFLSRLHSQRKTVADFVIDSHSECIPVGAWLALRAVVPLETCRVPTTRGSPPHPPMLRLADVGGFLFAGARHGFAVLSSHSLHIPSINPCHSVPDATISLPDNPSALLPHSFHIPFTFRSHSFPETTFRSHSGWALLPFNRFGITFPHWNVILGPWE